jgi:hypothetical protein
VSDVGRSECAALSLAPCCSAGNLCPKDYRCALAAFNLKYHCRQILAAGCVRCLAARALLARKDDMGFNAASLHVQALTSELEQCRDALAAAAVAAREEPLTPELRLAFIVISVLLVLFAGLMAGLTLGLLSLDRQAGCRRLRPPAAAAAAVRLWQVRQLERAGCLLGLRRVDLEVIKRSGSPKEVWLAERVEPVLARPHFLLATLLLCNSAAMEALPLFLDRLLNPAAAIILSGACMAPLNSTAACTVFRGSQRLLTASLGLAAGAVLRCRGRCVALSQQSCAPTLTPLLAGFEPCSLCHPRVWRDPASGRVQALRAAGGAQPAAAVGHSQRRRSRECCARDLGSAPASAAVSVCLSGPCSLTVGWPQLPPGPCTGCCPADPNPWLTIKPAASWPPPLTSLAATVPPQLPTPPARLAPTWPGLFLSSCSSPPR